MITSNEQKNEKGLVTTWALIFGVIFLIMLGGLLNFILTQLETSDREVAFKKSLHIAEAGADYYRWHLNHNPNDVSDGHATSTCTKEEGFLVCGPYQHDYYEPWSDEKLGEFALTIKSKMICGMPLGIYVISEGATTEHPELKRKIRVKFASTPIAEYAYMLGSSVWAGADRKIYGKYHSNGGIRMDGTHNSIVSSSESKRSEGEGWVCNSGFCPEDCPDGCVEQGGECICDGVCGGGSPKDYWEYSAKEFKFDGLDGAFLKIKSLAEQIETSVGEDSYYAPTTDQTGYHIVFKGNKYDIYEVDKVGTKDAYTMEKQYYHPSYEIIEKETRIQENVKLPGDCGIIYVEDNLWVEGTVEGKVTVVAANPSSSSYDSDVVFKDDLKYEAYPPDGSDSLAVMAENNMFIPYDSPNEMELKGVFVAKEGWFGRKHYQCCNWLWESPPCSWSGWKNPKCQRDYLNVYGSIVSKERVGTGWTDNSGYLERDNYFDEKLAKSPPPLLPYVSEHREIISWDEIE